jgi:hypothetical protein
MDKERNFQCPSTKRRCVEKECNFFSCIRRRAEAEHAERVLHEFEDRCRAALRDDNVA